MLAFAKVGASADMPPRATAPRQGPYHSVMPESVAPTTPGRRRIIVVAASIVLALALLYLVRLTALEIGKTEGDLPPVSALQLPMGSAVLSEQRACASGGCWLEIRVRPPEGMTPTSLAEAIGATPGGGHPGTWWDPRSISFYGEPADDALEIQLDYWR
ncbi:hypothetical protein [Agrococcus sp. KRD186]|uniref:hypothetical protein n=1 Tax=Agrococcus sp. KRD186 TaxID=2729730 RepID=UPI0019D222A5|nr:hypothetical protein [Agrococcus sp. KRD186]